MNLEFSGLPVHVAAREAVVGDTLDLTPTTPFGVVAFVIASRPAGSSAAFVGSRITLDTLGRYVINATMGGLSRTVTLFCFPAAALTSGPLARTTQIKGDQQGRRVLRSLVVNETATALAVLTALEGGASVAVAFAGETRWADFGALQTGALN